MNKVSLSNIEGNKATPGYFSKTSTTVSTSTVATLGQSTKRHLRSKGNNTTHSSVVEIHLKTSITALTSTTIFVVQYFVLLINILSRQVSGAVFSEVLERHLVDWTRATNVLVDTVMGVLR